MKYCHEDVKRYRCRLLSLKQGHATLAVRSNNEWKENAFVFNLPGGACSIVREHIPSFFSIVTEYQPDIRDKRVPCVFKPVRATAGGQIYQPDTCQKFFLHLLKKMATFNCCFCSRVNTTLRTGPWAGSFPTSRSCPMGTTVSPSLVAKVRGWRKCALMWTAK